MTQRVDSGIDPQDGGGRANGASRQALSDIEHAAGVTNADAYWEEVIRTARPGETLEATARRGLQELRRRAAARAVQA